MNEDRKLNNVFEQQLKKYGLSLSLLPSDISTWEQFLSQINEHYNDTDQHRYDLERSSEIISRETMELNEKLEDAQRFVNIGRWHFNKPDNKVTLSKEFFTLFGMDPAITSRTFEETLEIVHHFDSQRFIEMFEKSMKNG